MPPRRETRASANMIIEGQAEGEATAREEPLPPPPPVGVPSVPLGG